MRFQETFFADGTAAWNDGHELRFGHGTGHGIWEIIGDDTFASTLLWIAYDSTAVIGTGTIFKLGFTSQISKVKLDPPHRTGFGNWIPAGDGSKEAKSELNSHLA